jgi:c-di-GMP-binding flagellar brake protein YcgR
MMDIKPGLSVKLVVGMDPRTERVYARNSTVYDVNVNGERIVLAQTEPWIKSSMLDKEITVTYLAREKGRSQRYAFSAVITEFIDNYMLVSGQEARAVTIQRKSEPTPYNIRVYYRVEPTGRSGLDVSIDHKRLNVLDISLGGIKFTFDRSLELKADTEVKLYFNMEGTVYAIDATILRIWEGENERLRNKLGFASAEFLDMPGKLERTLSRAIREIEREALSSARLP